ncbi:MAG: transposase [Chloroflexota bacterium]|nr:transposase [Chloroflexota bacterium]
MLDHVDPAAITDPTLRALVVELLTLLNTQATHLQELRTENQRLRDEIARLTGEQGRPHINPQAPLPPASLSSEAERRTPNPRQPRSKQAHLTSTREEVCRCDRATLPPDAQFKGYEDVLVQDLRVECDVIRFRKEKFYSPSVGQTFLAPLPAGYGGQFGPDLHAFVLSQYFGANVSQPALQRLLGYCGVDISRGQLAHILTDAGAPFHAESSEVLAAGLASSFYQQADDTSTRVAGQNCVCQVLTNPCYTAYRTTDGKDRLSVVSALTDQQPLRYLLTARVQIYWVEQGLAAKWRALLADWPCDQSWTATELETRLAAAAWGGLPLGQAKLLREGLALGAYQAQTAWRPVGVLLVDDAPQWRQISPELGLCWVHEGRHYKKLVPAVGYFQGILTRFLGRFWCYYRQLQAYQAAPEAARARWLRAKFRRLFNTVTAYRELNAVIERTRGKERELLLVLKYPQLPLHNNAAELGARVRVRKRDVSFGPRSPAGRQAWDTYMTLVETTRKLGVNFAAYVRDRLRGVGAIPRLGELVRQKAASLNLTPA